MHLKVQLLATSALLAAALGTTAQAQTRSGTSAAATNTIEELVVTAEKREQSLQDVPVAVSAFTSEKRDLIGITTVQDMTNFTPGLEYNAQNDRNTLRGVGRNTNVHAAEGSVAQYSDGIYTSSTVEAGKTPLFVDRVEVLRGPQGTLYGRNAIGGAINILSKRPTEDWYAEARAQYQNYQHFILEGAASGPTPIPGVTFRVAANWEKQKEGWFENTVPGFPDEGNIIDTKLVEGQLKFKPNDKFEAWMKLSWIDWHNEGGGPGSRNTYTKVTFPAGTNGPNVVINTGCTGAITAACPAGAPTTRTVVLPAYLQNSASNPITFPTYESVNAGLVLTPGYACLPTSVTGITNIRTPNNMPLAQACQQAAQNDPRQFTGDVPYQVKLTGTTIFASEWIYHFDKMDLKYVAGGTHYHYHLGGPTPVEQAPITSFQLPFISGNTVIPGAANIVVRPRYWFSYEEIENWWSHELNLSSTDDGPLQWLLGAYYYNEDYEQPVSTTLLDQGAPVTNGPFIAGTCAFTPPPPGGAAGACVPPAGNNRIYDNRPELNIKSSAVFGQIDWAFAEHWKTTLGLRYTKDEKSGQEALRIFCFDVPGCAGPPERFTNFLIDLTQVGSVVSGLPGATTGGPGTPGVASNTTLDPATGFATRKYSNKWSATTGTAGIQWDPDPDTMTYLRYSRGYKAGGFRIGIDTVIGAAPNTDPEHADAFELGLKKNFGRTLQTNVALFYYKYDNAQIPITVAATAGGLQQAQSIFYNIPQAISQGVELESIWQPIDHLQFLFNYSYLDAHVTESRGVVDPADPAALDPKARPIITQAQCLAAVGTPQACSADAFTTGLPNGGFQRGQDLDGNHLPNAPEHKVAFNVNYTWDTGHGSLIGSASYIWRSEQYGSIFDRDYYKSPSYDQVDLRLTWKDADNRYTIIGFVRNLFDDIGYAGGAGAGRRAGSVPLYVTGNAPVGTQTATTSVPIIQGIASSYTITPPRTYGIEFQYRFF